MSSEEIITTKHDNRCYKKCRCGYCNEESVCTPNNDFYSLPREPEDENIYCEGCFRSMTASYEERMKQKDV